MLRGLGGPVFDAEAEVHRLQGPGGELVARIEAAFPGTTGPGGVDRQALGKWVLGNDVELKRLDALVHPAVYRARQMFLARHRLRLLVAVVVLLLFDTGGERSPDERRVGNVCVLKLKAWQV